MYLDFKRPSFGFVVLDSVLTSAMDRNDDNGAPRAKIRRLSSMFDIETTELPLPYPCNNLCIAFVIKNIEHYKSALLSKFFILQEVMFYEVAEALKNGVFLSLLGVDATVHDCAQHNFSLMDSARESKKYPVTSLSCQFS